MANERKPLVVASPPVEVANQDQGEDSQISQKRQSWFFDQRAYPFQHIPAGALQKAIAQRDAMRQRQRQASSGLQAQGIITFPGDALWHLMGPQPVNEPFSVNGGFPTASGRVTAIAVDPTTPATVYIGAAAGGVWKTTDSGAHWTPLTDSQPSLAVGSIAIDPNSCSPGPCQTIYVGTGEDNFNGDGFYGVGVLKSTNAGATWTPLGASVFATSLSPTVGGGQIGAIAVQPGNSSVIVAAVKFFDGNDPRSGIYQSLDGGVTWHQPTAGAQGAAGTGVVFDPALVASATGATVYAALGDVFSPSATNNGVWKSTDSGAHWTRLAGGLPASNVGRITLGYAPGTTGATATIYAAIADSSTNSSDFLGFFVTTNAGTNWTQLTNTPAFCNHQCFYDIAVGVSPTSANTVVVGGGAFTNNSTSLFKTTDGGTTWTNSTAGTDFTLGSTNVRPHVDTHAIVFTPNGASLYVGNDGGMWRTDNPGTTPPLWVDLNATLAITQFYPGISASFSDENYGFGGTQDNDTEVFSGTLDWANAFACGDGGFTAIDQKVPTTIYTGCNVTAGAKVRESLFNGQTLAGPTPTFVSAESEISASGDRMQFIPPLTIDPNNNNTLYFGTCRIWQTFNASLAAPPTWSPLTGDLTATNTPGSNCPNTSSDAITTIAVSPQSSSLVLAGTSNGKIWETTNGFTYSEIDNLVPGQLPQRHITAVRPKPNDTTGQTVYATFSGFGTCAGCDGKGHIFKTINGGATWTDISGDLPDAPVNDIIVDHSGNGANFNALYIATDVGVFSCPNPEAAPACTNWTVLGDGLPNSPVLSLAMRPFTRILRAGTHGRSMWDLQLTDLQPGALALVNSLTPAAVNVGAPTTTVTVAGINLSANTTVLFDGASVGTPTFVNTTQLTVNVNSSLLQDGHVFSVTLSDPAGVDSASSTGAGLSFTVMNPAVNPSTMTPGSALTYTALPLHFTGSGFVPGTIIQFANSSNVVLFQWSGGTASAGGTVFDITIPATLLTTAASYHVIPFNPRPGGGATGFFNFTLNANPNALAIFNPNPIVLGPVNLGGSTSLTNLQLSNPGGATLNVTAESITGTNSGDFSFVAPTLSAGQVSCNFETTHTVSLTPGSSCFFGMQFTADVPTGNVNPRTATLNVTDNGVGNPQAISILGLLNSAVVLVSPVNFGAVTVGTTSVTMNATLSNINTTAASITVNAPGFTLSGTDAADFHIVPAAASANPACPAAPFPLAANASCDVGLTFTPTLPPRSESATISVSDNGPGSPQSAPIVGVGVEITSISPSIVATGGPAFTLTVNGGGFASSAVVNVNGSARLTTFVNSGQLLASIPASDIATAGSLAITVTTPVPGGTTSEPKTLFVAEAPSATNDNVNFATNTTTTPFRITQDTTQATAQLTAFTGTPATPIDPTPCATGSTAKSVWFRFTAPATGKVDADTRFSTYTTNLSAWTISTSLPSSTATFAPVACNTGNIPASGSAPTDTLITFPVTSGTTYYLMVTDPAGKGGTLTFSLDFASAAPANDAFASATTIAAAPFSTTENTIQATANTGAVDPVPTCASGTGLASSGDANSVWFKFTAPSAGTITADTLTSPYATILTGVTGAPGSFTQVACNVSAAAGIAQSLVNVAATSGTTYFFMVSAFFGDGGTTNFHLTFSATTGPSASLAPSPVSFGNQRVNTTSSPVTATLTNSGTATLILAASNAVTITGTNAADFAIASGTTCSNGANVAAGGATCIINLTFKPGAAGARTATLTVTDNASPTTQSVTLNGTGTAPTATVTPNPVAFGNQRKGTTSAALAVTVKNTGTDTLNLAAANAVVIGGTNATDFANAAGSTCVNSTALAPNASCFVNITFTPATTAAEAGTLTITDDSNAVVGSAQVVNLTGTGIFPAAAATPNPLAFGNVPKSTIAGPLTVTLTNSGTDTLHLAAANAVVLSGTNAADFAIAAGTTCTNSASVAASGGACIVNVTFTPSTTAAESATLTITDDASPTTQAVSLTGTGTAASVALSPSPVPFGNQRVNTTSATSTVTLTNSGNASVTLSTPTLSITGTNAGDFAVVSSGTTCTNGAVVLASPGPGNTCVIKVTFTPGATGARTATLNVADSATPSPQSVTLNGTGTVPSASVAPLNIAFGNQRKGTTSAGTDVTVSNTGTDTLNVASVTLTGANPSQFVLGAPSTGTACSLVAATPVAASGNCKFSVKFAPTATGAQSANVTITDDSGGVGGTVQTVTLTGTGIAPTATVTPNPLVFGNQRKGTTSAALAVTVKNTGTDTLNLAAANAVVIGGTNATDFANGAGSTCVNSTALAPNASCIVNITFTPATTAAEAATLTITDDSNAVAGTAQAINLTGTGVFPQAVAAPSTLPFGNQPKGVQSAAQTITLTNAGTDNLHLAAANAVAISGPNAGDFAVAGTTTCTNGGTVAPSNGSCVINITFTPSTTAAESATVTINDDATPTTQTVSLTGTGTTATVNMAPSPLSFGNQRMGVASGAQTITLTNSGNASVQLAAANALSLSGANSGDFAITGGTCANNFTVSANGGACTITVAFTPSALGPEGATVTVTFQGGTPQASDNLTGTGVFPQASPAPSPLNFANQVVNTTSAALTITLSNPGTDTLHLAASNAVVISGTNAGDFAVAGGGTTCTNSATVAPSGNCVINVTFTPSALNARIATLTITDDASPTTQTVALNGTGTNPTPTITTLAPTSTTAGGASFPLTINGTGFAAGATVNFGANPTLTPTSITSTQIAVTVPAADIATAGSVNVTVTNPAPGGGTSAAATFTVNNPAPTLTSIAPTSGVLNQSVNLTLTGTNFVTGSVVNFGANADSGGVVTNNGNTLTITIPAAQLNATGPLNVTVTNPAPGGGTTTAQTFTVNNPVPTLTSIAPTSGVVNQSVNLTLTGTNFVAGSIVNFGANADNGGVVSNNGNTLTITIPAAQLSVAGSVNVTVTNPAPGGGTTTAQTFTVNNPVPTVTTLSPNNTLAGGISFALTVNGTNFVAASQVSFNGGLKPTTFVNATQLTATISAADIANAGIVNVTVTNPAPGGGTSTPAAQFTINNVQPTLTSLSPASTLAGGAAFALTVNGQANSFVSGAVVSFNGAPKTTTFVNSTQVTASITAADIAKAGTFNVTVTNPPPSVGPSVALTFTVNNPVPTITGATVGGQTHIAGGAAFTLTVSGTNFVSTSVVNFGNKAEPTTLVSGTQITAAIPASDVSTAGPVNVTVVNPAPGGGATPTSTAFTVDGYIVAGPGSPVTVKAGATATIPVTITPTANGFANQVTFAVGGLPAHASLVPIMVTPGNTPSTVNLMINTTARGTAPPTSPLDQPIPPLVRILLLSWVAALLAGIYTIRIMRRIPKLRRYAAIIPLALLLLSGGVLAGCASGTSGTPAGTSQLTITATSGTLSQSTSATLTVQ